MQRVLVLWLSIMTVFAAAPATQRRGAATGGRVTFAVAVADSAGKPMSGVKVMLSGPAQRTSSTEAGRLVFENLPAGTYHFRFERTGYLPVEKDVPGKGSAPIDVKVTLALPPPPPKPLAPVALPPAAAAATAKFVVLDMPAFIEKN